MLHIPGLTEVLCAPCLLLIFYMNHRLSEKENLFTQNHITKIWLCNLQLVSITFSFNFFSFENCSFWSSDDFVRQKRNLWVVSYNATYENWFTFVVSETYFNRGEFVMKRWYLGGLLVNYNVINITFWSRQVINITSSTCNHHYVFWGDSTHASSYFLQ